jgi:8-oxo-dGTP diphosphatase
MTKKDLNNLPYSLSKKFRPLVAVDILIFSIIDNALQILLIKRKFAPFADMWAIPGGFVREQESLENAARRELAEETGLTDVGMFLEQLFTFGEPKRDPRGRVISISYYALIPASKIGVLKAKTDASQTCWMPVNGLPDLAFDHEKIIKYALERLRYKMEYTNVSYALLDDEFTLTDLQKIYEVVFAKSFDKRNFRKKILSLGILEPTGKTLVRGVHRPAKTYVFINRKLFITEILEP